VGLQEDGLLHSLEFHYLRGRRRRSGLDFVMPAIMAHDSIAAGKGTRQFFASPYIHPYLFDSFHDNYLGSNDGLFRFPGHKRT